MPEDPVYLDHAATTPMLPAAIEAMSAHLADVGNPNSLHASGRHARRVVEESRETIAQAQGVVMARQGVTAEVAYAALRQSSKRTGTPVRHRAAEIVASTAREGPIGEVTA